ncbi:MAG: Stk1 family PASTA domain-containing Ser/Thr kinase [Actinomycetota bacterium]
MEEAVFNGRYRIIEKVGGGGMADVYRAEDQVLGRTVALKILHKQFASDEGFLERFRREARAAAKLTHPNIVSIYDVGEEGGVHFIVMEYVHGMTLKKLIQKDAPLSTEKVVHIGMQIAKAMEFAHEHEIIHRDIKPQNVIITDNGEIKVTDFGIARAGATSTMTRTGAVMGTAHYISPEQAQGSIVGPTTDVYSLGVVMYEMATGELPFRGENPVSVALKHINDTPIPPRSVFGDLPASLEAVIIKCMAKNPNERYRSAEAVRDDLKRVIEGLPVKIMGAATSAAGDASDMTRTMAAQSSRPAGGDGRRKPKKALIAAIIAVILLLLLGGGALAYSLLSTPSVVVPDIKGKTLSQAQQALDAAGLKLQVEKEVTNEKVAPGRVISQDPAAGEKMKKGGTVTVVMSKGLETVVAPDLTGKTEAEAAEALKKAGLLLGKVGTGFSDTVAEGQVMAQSPKAGARVEKGGAVDITISSGSQQIKVPDVTNNTVDAAISILENAGFKVDRFDDYNETIEKNHVIKQSPVSGDKAAKGSTVTITVSKGSAKVTLINLKGMKQADANAWLASNDLLVSPTTAAGPPGTVSGNVWDMNPASGVIVNRGSTVGIWVQP